MSSTTSRVIVAGSGVAGCAAAAALRCDNVEVTLVAPRVPRKEAIEAIPEQGVRALHSLGLSGALRRAGAVAVHGFDNAWEGPEQVRRLEGIWVHVERGSLGAALLDAVREQGVRVFEGPLSELGMDSDDATSPLLVDATGRSARWSRPVRRVGRSIASLYRGPGRAEAEPGRIARFDGGWAYRIAHPSHTTVGVVHDDGPPDSRLTTEVARALGLEDLSLFEHTGHRAAHAQWAEEPITERRVAVGDAAFACSPSAGQGVRFSVSSALAAASSVRARLHGAPTLGQEYYRAFVLGARRRHVAQLARLVAPATTASATHTLSDEQLVHFAATTLRAPVRQPDGLTMSEVFELPDEGLVRWVGGFDLRRLRDLACTPIRAGTLVATLGNEGVALSDARALVAWCVRQSLLSTG